jgi:hypothetical protein
MREGRKHQVKNIKRNKSKQKEYYTVRSLVEEITGLKELKADEKNDKGNFEAAYKEVQRIVQTMQEQIGSKGKIKIHHTQKEGFVQLTRALYFQGSGKVKTGKARELYEKMRKKEPLSEQEMIDLTKHYLDSWNANPDTSEKQALLEQVRIEEAFLGWMDDVKEVMLKDINLVDGLAPTTKKFERMEEYLVFLNEGLKNWRKQFADDRQEEAMMQRFADIAVEKGYDPMKVIHETDSYEHKEVFREMVERDSKILIKEFEKKMKQQLL